MNEWYSPIEVMHYTTSNPYWRKDYIEWVMEWYEVLKDGKWPRKGADNPESRGRGFEASIYPPAILGELHSRLKMCGRDGIIVHKYKCIKEKPKVIRHLYSLSQKTLDEITYQVMRYISKMPSEGYWAYTGRK